MGLCGGRCPLGDAFLGDDGAVAMQALSSRGVEWGLILIWLVEDEEVVVVLDGAEGNGLLGEVEGFGGIAGRRDRLDLVLRS